MIYLLIVIIIIILMTHYYDYYYYYHNYYYCDYCYYVPPTLSGGRSLKRSYSKAKRQDFGDVYEFWRVRAAIEKILRPSAKGSRGAGTGTV